MKKNVLWGFLAASVIVLCGASIARADDHKVTAKVPFDFVVGNSSMPAGRYEITTVGDDSGVLAITGADARRSMYLLATPRTVSDRTAPPQLVFEKIENQYVLVQITLEASDGHRAVVAPAGAKPALLVAAR
jgi:hypothetical protein